MADGQPAKYVDSLIDEVLSSTSLPFVREFLRSRKGGSQKILIGTSRDEVRRNLRDAIIAAYIGLDDLEDWFREIEGWGKQHLYLCRTTGKFRNLPHLNTEDVLRKHLKKAGFLSDSGSQNADVPGLEDVLVDDVFARLVWRERSDKWERHQELDETRRLDENGAAAEDGDEYEFRAWRRVPTRAASRFCFRKTDGAAVILLTHPLGEDHDSSLQQIEHVARHCVGACKIERVRLESVVGSLDQSAVLPSAQMKAKHGVTLDVEARQARYRADGAKIEFQTTLESQGYSASEPVRRVRKAMQVEKFLGEMGKFRLTFEADQKERSVVASLDGYADRCYLYSRMTEGEVWAFVDQLLSLT